MGRAATGQERLAWLLSQPGVTAQAVAAAAGVSEAYVSRQRNGSRPVTQEVLAAAALEWACGDDAEQQSGPAARPPAGAPGAQRQRPDGDDGSPTIYAPDGRIDLRPVMEAAWAEEQAAMEARLAAGLPVFGEGGCPVNGAGGTAHRHGDGGPDSDPAPPTATADGSGDLSHKRQRQTGRVTCPTNGDGGQVGQVG